MLHLRALLERLSAVLVDLLKSLDVLSGSLLEGQGLAPLGGVLEITLVTKGAIMLNRINCQVILVLAELYFGLHLLNSR